MNEEENKVVENEGSLEGDIAAMVEADRGAAGDAPKEETETTEKQVATDTATEAVTEANQEDDANANGGVEANAEGAVADLALIERGIRAGISIEDMSAMHDKKMATRMIEMAEKANGISKEPEKGNEVEGEADAADELGAALAEMESDGEYDPKILKLLKGLYNENKALKSARETAEGKSFFDRQVGSLDEGVRRHCDATRLSKLRAKFDMLERGYGKDSGVSREDVFKEAVQLALGDLVRDQAEERKAKAVEQRKNLTLARPGGENGQTRGGVPADDPFADFLEAMG